MTKQFRIALAAGVASAALTAGAAFAETELRMAWYNDGIEGEVMQDILDRFNADNPDINVVLDVLPYKAILESLPVQLAAGEGPDLARVTDLGGLSQYYMDLTPYISNPDYWRENFGPFLKWMQPVGAEPQISGFMTQLTVTGPYVNKTLFEQAGVAMPGENATWSDWAAASREVAEKLDIPIPMAWDRSGHRVAGPAISMGAGMFDADGGPALVDDGLKAMATMLYDWHQDGTMAKELWGSVSGSQYLGANEEFANAQTVLYMSGSWQIPQFAEKIGDAFDWWAVPAPCGPAACTGMPGGAALVALKTSEHPEEVGKLMDYLSSEEVLNEFYGRTLFIPGHLGLAKSGVDFQTEDPRAEHALLTFASAVPGISPIAFDLQGYVHNRVMFNALISRLGEAIVGELTLDQAFDRMTQDVEQQIAEKQREN
ncbi:sugar ABC transporter substrate-binding protein [Roseibium aquae]|uniref:sn-glycerol-3-phosphate-binding periplasmic protein UgpB n=1 Tax=Roseibium aquae TaxID=1323746 RepID=A0A916X2I5_9HYPH|nr:ABC transporter substrate-binding protein [Roseibium aquae]GGB53682.1 sugar ABC transporter substrate-binding protein [Roseibium aquae]